MFCLRPFAILFIVLCVLFVCLNIGVDVADVGGICMKSVKIVDVLSPHTYAGALRSVRAFCFFYEKAMHEERELSHAASV